MSKAHDTYASVWDAIADTAHEAANLRVRSELMHQLAAIIRGKRWTQVEAANHCGVTQPRINDLLRGRMSRFSLDALVNVAAALGQRVHIELGAMSRARHGAKKAARSIASPHGRQRAQIAANSRASNVPGTSRARPSVVAAGRASR